MKQVILPLLVAFGLVIGAGSASGEEDDSSLLGRALDALIEANEKPSQPGDRARVVTLDRLAGVEFDVPDGVDQWEHLVRGGDGSHSISIEYDFDMSDEAEMTAPVVMAFGEIHETPRRACLSHRIGAIAAEKSMEAESRNEVFSFGDQSSFAVISLEDEPLRMTIDRQLSYGPPP